MTEERKSLTAELDVEGVSYAYFPVAAIEGSEKLPYSLTVLLENVLRHATDESQAREAAGRIMEAGLAGKQGAELAYSPARVLLQDLTGVPVFVDLAVMREAMASLGGDPMKVNPQIPLDLVIDHSVIADEAGCAGAMEANMELEFKRNAERYTFLKWAQGSFENVRIVPPGMGICHQMNVEEFSQVAMVGLGDAVGEGARTVYFDTVVGTDSHTTTTNGIGVLSWGVGGIEAEAAALGQPITTLVPEVVGIRLTGALSDGVSAMDAALVFAKILRDKGVVGSFVECFGPGVAALSATQRACIANMTPEYGCTCVLFPVDGQTLDYLRVTGRSDHQVKLVEEYAKTQGFWMDPLGSQRVYADIIELDLSTIKRNLAGPSRPHELIPLEGAKSAFEGICAGRGLSFEDKATVAVDGDECELTHGALAIAAVTSCTTATDPAMMVACGLIAKKAAEAGLRAKPWVKRIFAPGSQATELLLRRAGLMEGLEALGFYTCGFGCMSCIGNSGPLSDAMHAIAEDIELTSILSSNRNFEGRISPDVSQNYLTSPAAVIAYALVGTMDFDFSSMPIGKAGDGSDVFLADIWPADSEVEALVGEYVTPALYDQGREGIFDGDPRWQAISVDPSATFAWDDASTYVRKAPYFEGMQKDPQPLRPIEGACVLEDLGDFITTDHISPAGSIALDSPAADYLRDKGVPQDLFNTYGSRRGNHEVMMRGTFANVKLQNKLAQGRKGHWTRDMLEGNLTSVFEAARDYTEQGVGQVVLAGKMYGSGSSRDWAAKGPALLGVRAVFAESFERIHRSNLIGMGVIPLQFEEGQNAETLGLDGTERFTIGAIDFSEGLPNPSKVAVKTEGPDGRVVTFTASVRVDTPTEGFYMVHGGILPYVLRSLA